MSIFIIGEIGINHNGDIGIAKELIDLAVDAGADAVKFQKRTIEKVYTAAQLDVPRESPWGTTNREQKNGLEFGLDEYKEIDRYCKEKGIEWFASAWDVESQVFIQQFDCKYNKVASAMLTHKKLLETISAEGRYTFISTGMSRLEEVDKAIEIFKAAGCPYELMHCNSSYPMPNDQANLSFMDVLRERYECKVGYSGHEAGLIVSVAAAALGATSIERHITLDRAMYGSDQAASIEIMGFHRLVSYIRTVEVAFGKPEKVIYDVEEKCKQALRRVDTL